MRLRALVLLASLAGAGVAAQSLDEQRRALVQAQSARVAAQARAADLDRAAANARNAAAGLRTEAAAVAGRIQLAEADIATAEARIAVIEQLRRAQRARLAERQGPSARLVAALETMARRPAIVALAQPGSLRELVHVHAVLAGVQPVVRARTAALRGEIARGEALRRAADTALAEERDGQGRLVVERNRLAALEAGQRRAAQGFTSSAMVEQDRAVAMGEAARDIGELMGRIDDSAGVRARLETLPGPIPRPARPGDVSAPTAEVARARIPAYRLPVVGTVVTGLGEVSDTGVRARGLTIATRSGAQVVAPTSGRIAFAAPFRGYGNIVVIDHGLGWTTLLTSLASIDVRVGDTVDRGSPIGRAGTDRPTVTVELRRRGQPVDIARLLG